MKKFLFVLFALVFSTLFCQEFFTSSQIDNQVFDKNLKAKRVNVVNELKTKQPSGLEMFNIPISSTSVSLLIDKNWNYACFYISNTTNSTLLISTSTAFTTSFRIAKGMIFSSDVIATLYGKIVEGGEGGVVDVMIEKK